jgi:hypothetical protein
MAMTKSTPIHMVAPLTLKRRSDLSNKEAKSGPGVSQTPPRSSTLIQALDEQPVTLLFLDKMEKTSLIKGLVLVVHTRESDSVACIYRQRK